MVLASKPDGSLRFCVKYRQFNKFSFKDRYPIPRIDEFVDSMGDADLITTQERQFRILSSTHGGGGLR